MIILDTNVISEPMRPTGNPAVQAWLDRQDIDTLFLTATSLSELLLGIEILPAGNRKERLNAALNELLARLFASRILPFDQQAATIYATLSSRVRAKGAHLAIADGQIAAIAASHGFSVATRDTAPFLAAGIPVINPWQE